MAEIAVIVPVYKVEKYIIRCVDSIRNQTFTDFVLILVDDGSPDHCGAICDRYSVTDSRIHVIHQENGGLSAARNAGIDFAFADGRIHFLTFIDSDDWVHPQYLERLYHAALTYRRPLAVGEFIRTNGEPLAHDLPEHTRLWKTDEYYKKKRVNAIVAWGKLYQKDCFASIRFPVGKIHEDEYVTYRILFQCESIPVVEAPLYAYFQNEAGIMKRNWTLSRLDIIGADQDQVRFFLENGYTDIAKKQFIKLTEDLKRQQIHVLKCETITEREKKNTCRHLKQTLRKELIRYRRYHWLPYQESERNRQTYANAFTGIRICRRIWRRIIQPLSAKNPLSRSLGGRFQRIWRNREKIVRLIKYGFRISFKQCIILQSPLYGNLGDHAITKAESELLEELGISCCDFPCTKDIEYYCAKITSEKKVILINGGGYLGALWPKEEKRFLDTLQAFHKNRIIVFPQTIYFNLKSEEGIRFFKQSKGVYEGHPRLTLFVREKTSLDFMKEYMPKVHVELVPDIVLNLKWERMDSERHGILVCLRNDKERTISDDEYDRLFEIIRNENDTVSVTDTVVSKEIGLQRLKQAVYDKLKEFSAARLVITDRLHGMVFAAITETPCIVIDSLSPKIRGCHQWIKELDYVRFAESIDDIPELIEELKSVKPAYNREIIEEALKPLKEALIHAVR
ncbi:MAG: glycosyltransferase [Blautia sp.]|nr:glycosyltransferase [Blautia sp.]